MILHTIVEPVKTILKVLTTMIRATQIEEKIVGNVLNAVLIRLVSE